MGRTGWAAGAGALLLNAGRIRLTGKYALDVANGFFCNGTLENTYLDKLSAGTRLLVIKFTADGGAYLKPLLPPAAMPFASLPDSFVELLTAIRQTPHALQQAALLDTFLVRQLPFDITGNHLLQMAAGLVRKHKGKMTVSELCTLLKVNYKWLERNFRISTGVTPKNYIDNIRFLHAWFDVHASAQSLTASRWTMVTTIRTISSKPTGDIRGECRLWEEFLIPDSPLPVFFRLYGQAFYFFRFIL